MLARLLPSTLLLSTAISAGCGQPDVATAPSSRSQAIINGETCTRDTNPSALAILVDATVDFAAFGGGVQDITTVLCTGTLIAPDVVLTAAHCTDLTALTFGFGEVQREEFYVSFEPDLSALAAAGGQPQAVAIPESALPAREYARHEGFSLDAMQSVNGPGEFKDVALIFLSAPVDGVRPELVIDPSEVDQLVEGAAVEIAGWGQQTATGQFEQPPPDSVGIKVCGTTTINEVGETEMQVGADSTTTRKCHGDSGGPTYLEVETTHDVKRRVVGITSHAYDQSDCAKGGVDTRVDAYLEWIDAEMRARCTSGTRVWCDEPGIIPPAFFDAGDDDDDDDDGEPDVDPPGGCPGCAQAGADVPLVVGLIGLLFTARRRRRAR